MDISMDISSSLIKPLAPARIAGWLGPLDASEALAAVGNLPSFPCAQWFHERHGLLVLSAVEVAVDKGGFSRGPEYHISISRHGSTGATQRASSDETSWVLNEFGADGAEEDNHVPHGRVRNFWLPIAQSQIGNECPCKDEETAIVEGDYVWRP